MPPKNTPEYQRMYRARVKVKPPRKYCPVCGKRYQPVNVRQVYCDKNCKQKAHYERNVKGQVKK